MKTPKSAKSIANQNYVPAKSHKLNQENFGCPITAKPFEKHKNSEDYALLFDILEADIGFQTLAFIIFSIAKIQVSFLHNSRH